MLLTSLVFFLFYCIIRKDFFAMQRKLLRFTIYQLVSLQLMYSHLFSLQILIFVYLFV